MLSIVGSRRLGGPLCHHHGMAFGRSIQLARVFGIRIGVNPTWFVVLFLVILSFSSQFRSVLHGSDSTAYATAVGTALLFFCSIVLHELGHALTARRHGLEVSGIELWLFGGVSIQRGQSDTPGTDFKIAVAGPAVTLAVIAICSALSLAVVGSRNFADAVTLSSTAHVTPLTLLLTSVGSWNAVLLLFNLIPAYPLDGGRIARAIAWRLTGDRLRGTRFAARLGQLVAYGIMAFAVVMVIRTGGFAWIWLLFLAWFIGQGARAELAQTIFAERLGTIKVADIMDREPVTISSSTPAEQALDEFFRRYGWDWFAVVDPDGRFVGIVQRREVEDAVAAGELRRAVGELMDADAVRARRVAQEASLPDLLTSVALQQTGALMAVDGLGILRGVVTVEQVQRALQTAIGPRPS